MNKEDKSKDKNPLTEEEKKLIKEKQKKKAELERFKSKYFEYYDDIKISDRQDW